MKKYALSRGRVKRGFTLVELLVVLAIIALLASLLIPSVQSSLDGARMTRCASNMRQIGAAIMLFAADNNGSFPYSNADARRVGGGQITWDDLLSGYDGRDPLDPNSGSPANGMRGVLGYDEHGPQPLYRCPSFENPESLYYGGMRAIPRSYCMSLYDPYSGNGGNWAIGVSGYDIPGKIFTNSSGQVQMRWSRTFGQVASPGNSILLSELNRGNMLGRWIDATQNGPTFRNNHCSGSPWNTTRGAHSGGRLDNFLMADGRVVALDFVDTATLPDGTLYYAGGNWRGTMWDAGDKVR